MVTPLYSVVMALTEKEWDEWSALTEKVELGQRMPPRAFYAKSAKFGVVSIELAVIRQREDASLEILLERRPADDPFYALQWHMNGTIIVAGEADVEALHRLGEQELPSLDVSAARKLYTFDFPHEKHGPSHNQLHLLELSLQEQPKVKANQAWFPLDKLPEPMVAVHTVMLDWLREYLRVGQNITR